MGLTVNLEVDRQFPMKSLYLNRCCNGTNFVCRRAIIGPQLRFEESPGIPGCGTPRLTREVEEEGDGTE